MFDYERKIVLVFIKTVNLVDADAFWGGDSFLNRPRLCLAGIYSAHDRLCKDPASAMVPLSRATASASFVEHHRMATLRRFELADERWGLVEPLFPKQIRGRRWNDHRVTLNGMLWILCCGSP